MSIVYWIRRPEHINMFTDGYIGVTSRELEDRMVEHIKNSKGSSKESYIVHNAIKSIGIENLIYSAVLIADEAYCYEAEYKLRPEKRIGWNLAVGGSKPPSQKGSKHTDEAKEKISKVWKGKKRSEESVQKSVDSRRGFKHSEETIERLREINTGKKMSPESVAKRVSQIIGRSYTDEHKDKISKARLSKDPWELSTTNFELWAEADTYYQMWLDEKSPYKTSRKLGLTHKALEAMFRRFESGYIPLETEVWIATFKPNESEEFENA